MDRYFLILFEFKMSERRWFYTLNPVLLISIEIHSNFGTESVHDSIGKRPNFLRKIAAQLRYPCAN